MLAATEAMPELSIAAACEAFDVPRASWYHHERPLPVVYGPKPAKRSPRALAKLERQKVLETLNNEEFQDDAPAAVVATLLDRGEYLCSERTMYRILADNAQVRERRKQRQHPVYTKPELLATAPNQVWSWDITKLKGPVKWSYFQLYVILDIYSRYVVGWLLADCEDSKLAVQLMTETIEKEKANVAELTIHADNGPAMTSKHVTQLLADLGVTKSHSRPHVSDDNPYSESQFKTMKYQPEFPARFGSMQDARAHCQVFFAWYNNEHHHSGIEMLTPAQLHTGRGAAVLAARARVMVAAYALNSDRFVNGKPVARKVPAAAWINPPLVAVDGQMVH